jgi:hypothetical protein
MNTMLDNKVTQADAVDMPNTISFTSHQNIVSGNSNLGKHQIGSKS